MRASKPSSRISNRKVWMFPDQFFNAIFRFRTIQAVMCGSKATFLSDVLIHPPFWLLNLSSFFLPSFSKIKCPLPSSFLPPLDTSHSRVGSKFTLTLNDFALHRLLFNSVQCVGVFWSVMKSSPRPPAVQSVCVCVWMRACV